MKDQAMGGVMIGTGGNVKGTVPNYVKKEVLKGHMKRINKLIFHPTYPLIASASDDGSIRLWDYEVPEWKETFKGHTGHISYISFNREGTKLASGSSDTHVKIWDI